MPTFSTNPKWYNSAGVLDESLTGTAYNHNKCSNVAYGLLAEAGNDTGTTDGAVAIGDYARAFAPGSVSIGGRTDGEKSGALSVASGAISIGSSAQVTQLDGIAIGRDANASGGIAIGPGATTSGEMDIQLGNNNQAYTLSIGNKNQSAVCAGSYKIGENTVIDNNRSISGNSLNINNKLNISSDGTVSSSKYIYTTDYVSAYSYRINNKAGSFTTVIDSDKNIVGNNISGTSVTATGSIKGDNIVGNNIISNVFKQDLFGNGSYIYYNYLNLKNFKNRASESYALTDLTKKISGSGSVRFGFYNFSEITPNGADCLYLVKIVASGGVGDQAWENEYSSLLSTIDAKGKCIFDIYTNNTLVNDQYRWGTVGVTFWYTSEFDSNSRECFLTYSGTTTEITVTCKIYLIGNNGQS